MLKKYLIPSLAGLGALIAIVMVVLGLQKPPTPPIDHPPAKSPYLHYVAGSGIIEASSLNVNIGTAIQGPVEHVFVQSGDILKKGDPLFRVDTRELASLARDAEVGQNVALASFNRLVNEPRPEQIPLLEAEVQVAKVRLSDEYTQYNLFQNVSDRRAISYNDYNQRKYATGVAKAQYEKAQADLALLQAGAWIEDIKVANMELEKATAQYEVAKTQLDRATIRAPFDGMVMQVNINVGDFAMGSREDNIFQDSLMVYGAIDPMHVRIDVDEDDAWRVYPGAPAYAFVRGNSDIKFPLEFVRIEPYVVPKRTLTGENLERVDTRVLQLIYRFRKGELPIYLGQLLDVFIEAKPSQGL